MIEREDNICDIHSEQSESSLDALIVQARIAYNSGDFPKVVCICEKMKAIAINISHYGAYLYPALCELGLFDEALFALDVYAQDSGDDCHAPVDRLKVLYLAHRWEDAAASAGYILERWPFFISEAGLPEVYLIHGTALAMLGDELGAWRAICEGIKIAQVNGVSRADLRQLGLLVQKKDRTSKLDIGLLSYRPSIEAPCYPGE